MEPPSWPAQDLSPRRRWPDRVPASGEGTRREGTWQVSTGCGEGGERRGRRRGEGAPEGQGFGARREGARRGPAESGRGQRGAPWGSWGKRRRCGAGVWGAGSGARGLERAGWGRGTEGSTGRPSGCAGRGAGPGGMLASAPLGGGTGIRGQEGGAGWGTGRRGRELGEDRAAGRKALGQTRPGVGALPFPLQA